VSKLALPQRQRNPADTLHRVLLAKGSDEFGGSSLCGPASLLFSSTVASMASLGGVTDFLPRPFIRVRKQRPAARLFMSQTLMPKRDQPLFHIDISGVRG